jgi:hypothetical protein
MRVYDLLLRLYPASFRNEYGDEMRPLFARRRAQATGLGIVTLWLGTIGEVVANAIAVHVDILKQDVSYGRVLRRSWIRDYRRADRRSALARPLLHSRLLISSRCGRSCFPNPIIVTPGAHAEVRNNLSPANSATGRA